MIRVTTSKILRRVWEGDGVGAVAYMKDKYILRFDVKNRMLRCNLEELGAERRVILM